MLVVQALSVTVTVLGNHKCVAVSDCHYIFYDIQYKKVLFGRKKTVAVARLSL